MKILYLVSEDWYFISHRLSLAIAAVKAGYKVSVVTRVSKHQDAIREAGLTLIPLRFFRRSNFNPFQEIALIKEIWDIYHREKPAIVHHIGLKCVLYGSLISRCVEIRGVVNALGGLGFIFSSPKVFARFLRPLIKKGLAFALKGKKIRVIVQNRNDFEMLTTSIGINSDSVRIIRGAGVDLRLFRQKLSNSQPPLVVLVARMLWDKGVGDFVEAAIRIHKTGLKARFALVGVPDSENPTSVPEAQLRNWHDRGEIEWWGYRADIPSVLARASIACLPTFYGEGVPKALIEAMASRRPIVTTDIPGCRELVDGGRNGILVAPRDVDALTAALVALIRDPEQCRQMGNAGRLMVEKSLSLEYVIKETISIYQELVPLKKVG